MQTDLFSFSYKSKRLDKDSESFISLVHSLNPDSVRLICESKLWFDHGFHSRIEVYFFDINKHTLRFTAPAEISHRIMCRL